VAPVRFIQCKRT